MTVTTAVQGPTLLALDFDGVLCDGLSEYFRTSWRVYRQVWKAPVEPPPHLEAPFQRLRPVIETGWEMPVLLYALCKDMDERILLKSWPEIAQQIVLQENLNRRQLAHAIDHTRDHWIQSDLEDWIRYHRLYPGVTQQLQSWLQDPTIKIQIITTKEGRFAHQILTAQGIDISRDLITGKECGVAKSVSLRQLQSPQQRIWFVEDRLKTLQAVQAEPDLGDIRLFLAEWGYVTEPEQQQARQMPGVQVLSLQQFNSSFRDWL